MVMTRSSYYRRGERGMVLVIALFMVVIVMLVAVALLENASYAANDALSVQTKNQTFDAAEAGLNVAVWQIDQDNLIASGNPTPCSSPVNGYSCKWEVVYNGLHGAGATVPDPNPAQSSPITVGPGQALLAGWSSSILGGRTVYVEQIVAPGAPTFLPKGAIICGQNAIISHQQITDISGHHGADIRCGSITTSGGGQTPDGNSYASGSINQLVGFDGVAHTDQTPPMFLTAGELSAIQSSTRAQAQSGLPNFYAAGDVSSGVIGSSGASCVAYIGGSITLRANGSLTNYCTTTVVMGDVTISGNPTYQASPASTTHIMYVFGTNGATLNGTPTTWGIVYSANAGITINGAGYGVFNGSVITPYNVTMNGGGNASFHYNGLQTPPPVPNPDVVPESQWEY